MYRPAGPELPFMQKRNVRDFTKLLAEVKSVEQNVQQSSSDVLN
jgi:hypothetical protein